MGVGRSLFPDASVETRLLLPRQLSGASEVKGSADRSKDSELWNFILYCAIPFFAILYCTILYYTILRVRLMKYFLLAAMLLLRKLARMWGSVECGSQVDLRLEGVARAVALRRWGVVNFMGAYSHSLKFLHGVFMEAE